MGDRPLDEKQIAVLEVLRAGPSWGLEVIERVKANTKSRILLHQGNVYPILRGLEADGFLDSYEGEPLPERGDRPRRYYKLTEVGRGELAKPFVPIAGGCLSAVVPLALCVASAIVALACAGSWS